MTWDFTNVRSFVAAKPHRCLQCDGPIEQGARHYYFAGKFDGDFMSYREHTACRDAWLALNNTLRGDDDDGDGFPFLSDDAITPSEMAWLRENHPECASHLEALAARRERRSA